MSALVKPRFSTNIPDFNRAIDAFAKANRKSRIEAFTIQIRLLFGRLINWRGNAIATPPKTQAQGKKAVKRDIYHAVFPLRAEGFNDVKLRKRVRTAIEKGDHVSLQALAKAGALGRQVKNAFVAKFDPVMHQSQRRTRGRVRSQGKDYKFATDDVEKLKAYVEKTQGMVGQGKGGWAAAFIHLGGKPAQWIARHAKAGTFSDRLLPSLAKFSFTGINRSAWASGGDEDRIIDWAMEGRAAAIMKDLERRMEKDWKRAA